jgi:hypothetical protein
MQFKILFILLVFFACGVPKSNFYTQRYTHFSNFKYEQNKQKSNDIHEQYKQYLLESKCIDTIDVHASLTFKETFLKTETFKITSQKDNVKAFKINSLEKEKSGAYFYTNSDEESPRRRGGFENTRSWIKGITVISIGLLMLLLSNFSGFGVLFAIFGYTLIFFGLIMIVVDFI